MKTLRCGCKMFHGPGCPGLDAPAGVAGELQSKPASDGKGVRAPAPTVPESSGADLGVSKPWLEDWTLAEDGNSVRTGRNRAGLHCVNPEEGRLAADRRGPHDAAGSRGCAPADCGGEAMTRCPSCESESVANVAAHEHPADWCGNCGALIVDGVAIVPDVPDVGDAQTLTPERVRDMSPEERATWEQIVGKPLLDAISAWDPGANANGAWTVTSVDRAAGVVLRRR